MVSHFTTRSLPIRVYCLWLVFTSLARVAGMSPAQVLPSVAPGETASAIAVGDIPVFESYDPAYMHAQRSGGLLIVVFTAEKPSADSYRDELTGREDKPQPSKWIDSTQAFPILEELKILREDRPPLVLAWLSTTAATKSGGRVIRLLDHPAFAPLRHSPGLAFISFQHETNPVVEQLISLSANPDVFARLTNLLAAAGEAEVPGQIESRIAPHFSQRESGKEDTPENPSRIPPAIPKEIAGEKPQPPVFRAYPLPICNLEPLPLPIRWHDNYASAYDQAAKERRPLLIYFRDDSPTSPAHRFDSILESSTVREFLRYYVCARLPLSATTVSGGKEVLLLQQPAFSEMLGLPGLAIVDLAHTTAEYYGTVVSVFPFLRGQPYTLEQLLIILTLPPGTLTQRTLIYAVRSHPERPRSADGIFDPYLAAEASHHADYQARIGVQGHHFWESRFHKILSRLPFGLVPQEVCAESWPGQNILESAIECVRCWRLSQGHWSAVARYHPYFGYDMKRGANGVWYATGIFAKGGLLH